MVLSLCLVRSGLGSQILRILTIRSAFFIDGGFDIGHIALPPFTEMFGIVTEIRWVSTCGSIISGWSWDASFDGRAARAF